MMSNKKTFKRETAWVLFLLLGYVVYQGDVEMAKVLTSPIFLFAGLAFGLDWKSKQG